MSAKVEELRDALMTWKRFADSLSPDVPDDVSIGLFANGGMYFGPSGGASVRDLRRARDVLAEADVDTGTAGEDTTKVVSRKEFWWIYSGHDAPWAGLRIAVFLVVVGDHQLFMILNEAPDRTGPRSWDDVSAREGWTKVEQILVPEILDKHQIVR